MKKITLLLSLVLITLVSCSKSDSSSSSSNNTLKINTNSFVPGKNTNNFNYVFTSYLAGQNSNSRFFTLNTDINSQNTPESIQIEVIYPSTQSSINGTYSLDLLPGDENNYAICNYSYGINSYQAFSGNLTVSDLGNNKFQLKFEAPVVLKSNDPAFTDKTLTGSYTGTFAFEN
jgi:hypothetical protein